MELVVAVGDLKDQGCSQQPCPQMQTRAAFAQALYNAGIGFFPVRGNHDASPLDAREFQRLFPQTQNGVNNVTPEDAFSVSLSGDTAVAIPSKTGSTFTVGTNFSSPWEIPGLLGLSYSFDHHNARMVFIDQFTPTDNSRAGMDDQLDWIDRTLQVRPAGGHAFVFGHKHLISDNHADTLFGANPASDPIGQDAFIRSLADNNVHYYVGGHDHIHLDSVFTTTDGVSGSVHDLVTASDSSKFYTPVNPANEAIDQSTFGHQRQTRISEDLYQIGYYIFTVDGPRVTVDYYAVPVPNAPQSPTADYELVIDSAPALAGKFTKRASFGYSLNGKEFLIAQGQKYTGIADSFLAPFATRPTVLTILAGTNASTAKDALGITPLTKAVDTGWSEKTAATASDIVSLWGMTDLGATSTDTFVIQLSYDPSGTSGSLSDGTFGIVTRDEENNWVNAVSKNAGGSTAWVSGAWSSGAALGSYGVDPEKKVAWAVVNHDGDFAVAKFATVH